MLWKYISLVFLVVGSILAIVFRLSLPGYASLALGTLALIGANRQFAKHIGLVFISVSIIAAAPIDTRIDFMHMVVMGSMISTAVLLPYLVTRYVYKDDVIRFPFYKHTWTRGHIGYILLTVFLSYILLPFWMNSTKGYLNWTVINDPWHLFVLFLGTNGLGIWDELFFIVTTLALLKRHLPFLQANIVQAILFTSFLYELGFRGWAPWLIFPFALLQGEVFRRTDNLLYIIAIHLSIDFVLYLALINAHIPTLLDIFIT